MKPSHSKTFTQLFFALLLLVVQVQISSHQAEFEEHTDESGCEFCIHFGQLADGAFGESNEVTPARDYTVYPIPSRTTVGRTLSFYLPQPRAPPVASLT